MKRVICISPHFPPVNAPDMHRLRQALPYLREFGWEPVVFAVDPRRVEGARDELLMRTVPSNVEVRLVEALPPQLTRLVGLGNLGFRSWYPLRKAVSDYLAREGADLVFFTTTVFASIAHGPYWKRRFGVPFVVDLQDPWRNDYYLTLPPEQRPPKFWFDHWQKSRLEASTMPHADGMIAVSQAYIDTMRSRYAGAGEMPAMVLPFGAVPTDFEVAESLPSVIAKSDGIIDVVYVGRGGIDLGRSLSILFRAVQEGLKSRPADFSRLKFHFLGTSYAPDGQGAKTMAPVAARFGLASQVVEAPNRLPYFSALRALLDADILVAPGSDDPGYTASKIFPYIHSRKPLLAIFHRNSSVVDIVRGSRAGEVVAFGGALPDEAAVAQCKADLERLIDQAHHRRELDRAFLEPYSAREMTRSLTRMFEMTARKS